MKMCPGGLQLIASDDQCDIIDPSCLPGNGSCKTGKFDRLERLLRGFDMAGPSLKKSSPRFQAVLIFSILSRCSLF